MKEMKQHTIAEICSRLSSGKGIPASKVTPTGPYPVIGGNGVRGYTDSFNFDGECAIIGRQGANCGNVRYFQGKAYMTEHAIVAIGNENANTKYLACLFSLMHLGNLSAQSAQPGLSVQTLSKQIIYLPKISTQNQIADIIKSLDTKIEINKQINDNLEQQIQTLYREWFIDNPKTEWATIALSEVATFVSGYSYKGNELVDSSETAMATIKNFERNGGFKLDGYKPVSPSSKLKEEQHAELFDILVAHTDLTQNAEVIGNAEIILSKDSYRDVIFSMDLVKVVAKESFPYQFLLALLLKNPVFKSHCIGYVNGTTVLHMNKRALPDFNTQIPTCEDAARMNEIAKSIFTKMSENLSEIANLTKLRDSLLPKLMSGELKINEIDC